MSSMPRQKPGRSKQDYRTPPEFLRAVKSRLGIEEFAHDLAASPSNPVARSYYTEKDNALSNLSWNFNRWAWLNPPYSDIEPWVRKAWHEAESGAQIAMLIPASVGANWWRTWVEDGAYQVFLNGRLTFPPETKPYPKDCALLLYHPWGFRGHEIWSWRYELEV